MREISFSKSAQNLIRFFCINGIIVEALCILRLFLRTDFNLEIPQITSLLSFLESDLNLAIVDSISLVFFIIVFIRPKNIIFFAIITFLYSFKIILVDTLAENPLGQSLYLLGVSCLLYIDFYKKHRKAKIISSILLNLILIGHSLRLGVIVFINSLIVALGYGLVLLVTIFFTTNFLKLIHIKKTARIWDLSKYSELTQRDKEWLKQILDEKKYDEIAKDSGITVGTFKNRMHQVFNVVGVEDRISLLATYGGYEIKF